MSREVEAMRIEQRKMRALESIAKSLSKMGEPSAIAAELVSKPDILGNPRVFYNTYDNPEIAPYDFKDFRETIAYLNELLNDPESDIRISSIGRTSARPGEEVRTWSAQICTPAGEHKEIVYTRYSGQIDRFGPTSDYTITIHAGRDESQD